MKKIPLTKGEYALVDDDDYDFLTQRKWCASGRGYAVSRIDGKLVPMHRLVNKTPAGKITDHINRDRLDNRKSNLRTASYRLNGLNRGLQVNNKSGYKGVSWHSVAGKWEASVKKNGKKKYIGVFDTPEKANQARLVVSNMLDCA